MFSKKSITIMLIIIGVLIVFIVGLLFWKNYSSNFYTPKKTGQGSGVATTTSAAAIEAGKRATENLIDELKKEAQNPTPGSLAKTVTVDRLVDGKVVSEQGVIVATGTSPISVATGEVIAKTGGLANNAAKPGKQDSPTQSFFYLDPNKLPQNTIKVTLNSNNSMVPNSFIVHPGQAVSLAIINNTARGERIIFDDQSLAAISFTLMPGTTQAITFSAPSKMGEYIFATDLAPQRDAGMQGKMIVQ
jgi:hypothetical protein